MLAVPSLSARRRGTEFIKEEAQRKPKNVEGKK